MEDDLTPTFPMLLPKSLRTDFLSLVHQGAAGHLGNFKTAAHVARRAYWYQWRRDVELFCRRCPKCSEFHKGKLPPRQGNLVPMVLGSLFER